jgi:hypothetical protein
VQTHACVCIRHVPALELVFKCRRDATTTRVGQMHVQAVQQCRCNRALQTKLQSHVLHDQSPMPRPMKPCARVCKRRAGMAASHN